MGKASFAHLQDMSGKIQLYVARDFFSIDRKYAQHLRVVNALYLRFGLFQGLARQWDLLILDALQAGDGICQHSQRYPLSASVRALRSWMDSIKGLTSIIVLFALSASKISVDHNRSVIISAI